MSELKNCPFCGGDQIGCYVNEQNYNVIQCGNCGAMVSHYDYLPVEKWNTRATGVTDAEAICKAIEVEKL